MRTADRLTYSETDGYWLKSVKMNLQNYKRRERWLPAVLERGCHGTAGTRRKVKPTPQGLKGWIASVNEAKIMSNSARKQPKRVLMSKSRWKFPLDTRVRLFLRRFYESRWWCLPRRTCMWCENKERNGIFFVEFEWRMGRRVLLEFKEEFY